MNPQEQIKALAELDGWTKIVHVPSLGLTRGIPPRPVYTYEYINGTYEVPSYLTSYDAIIPVIHKKLNRYTCHSFFDALGLLAIKDWQDIDGAPSYEGDGSYFEIWVLFKATPQQLCEALLRATGNWIE